MDWGKDFFRQLPRKGFIWLLINVCYCILSQELCEFYVFPCLDYNIEDDNLQNLLFGTIVQTYHPVQSSPKNQVPAQSQTEIFICKQHIWTRLKQVDCLFFFLFAAEYVVALKYVFLEINCLLEKMFFIQILKNQKYVIYTARFAWFSKKKSHFHLEDTKQVFCAIFSFHQSFVWRPAARLLVLTIRLQIGTRSNQIYDRLW